jgi:23S rRNA (cytosine1962-C5)-methyltransferase
MDLPIAIITDRVKKRLRGKHPWIFSNELEVRPEIEPGSLVSVRDRSGYAIALGYYNPHTLIAIRILSFHQEFNLAEKIRIAADYRKEIYSENYYRVVYSESDGLPGLIVDRYDDILVAQILTAGMEKMRGQIINSLRHILEPAAILLRNDSSYRKLEGLECKVEWAYGEPQERKLVTIDGLKFVIDFVGGQKSGFFLDQQENRKRLQLYAKGTTMLDAFCYTGSWSMYGARAGFQNVTAVDSSKEALAITEENARLNQFPIRTILADVFDFLKEAYADTSNRYDLIVLDPPAFCKSKRHLPEALKGYREINLRAMKLLNKGGILFTSSCSQPVDIGSFLEVLRHAAADSGRTFRIQEIRLHPPDHPVLLHFAESLYLKCVVLQLQ